MSKKTALQKLKKKLGIKGVRLNVTCKCGENLRLKMNNNKLPIARGGERIVKRDPWLGRHARKPLVEVSVNPTRCPNCDLFAETIIVDTNNTWRVANRLQKIPSTARSWRHRH